MVFGPTTLLLVPGAPACSVKLCQRIRYAVAAIEVKC